MNENAIIDFDNIVKELQCNYAGFSDKTNGRETEYSQLKNLIRDEVAETYSKKEVLQKFKIFIEFFSDNHLGIVKSSQEQNPKRGEKKSPTAWRLFIKSYPADTNLMKRKRNRV